MWDLYSDHFSANEAAMINCEGDLIDPNDRYPSIQAPQVESYLSKPSIHVVNASIDKVIANGIDNWKLLSHP